MKPNVNNKSSMDIENKTLEILDLVREKVLSPDEALPHILRLFSYCRIGQLPLYPITFDEHKKLMDSSGNCH